LEDWEETGRIRLREALKYWLLGWELKKIDLGFCPFGNFGVGSTKRCGSTTTELVMPKIRF
jgi:hypothetical protein